MSTNFLNLKKHKKKEKSTTFVTLLIRFGFGTVVLILVCFDLMVDLIYALGGYVMRGHDFDWFGVGRLVFLCINLDCL
jgi:hypothetical protein